MFQQISTLLICVFLHFLQAVEGSSSTPLFLQSFSVFSIFVTIFRLQGRQGCDKNSHDSDPLSGEKPRISVIDAGRKKRLKSDGEEVVEEPVIGLEEAKLRRPSFVFFYLFRFDSV